MAARGFYNIAGYDFFNPANWTPTGVPQRGDNASISRGAAVAGEATLPSGVSIGVFYRAGLGAFGSISLRNVTIPFDTVLTEFTMNNTYGGPIASDLVFAGTVVNNGTVVLQGGIQLMVLPSGTTLTNNGTINVDGSAPRFSAGGAGVSFVNNGLIRVVNPTNQTGQLAVFGPAIGGTGTISVSVNTAIELGGAVLSGQTLAFVGGVGANASVRIDQPNLFSGGISGFVSGDMLALGTTTATSVSYIPSGARSGMLQILDGANAPVASLQFSGSYATNNFSLSQSGSSLVVTTNVTDATSGSTAASTSSGVYRFFDTSDGTHFYTANFAERDTVLAERTDLLKESNDFGAQTTVGPATVSVYRFFDGVHGTHFFTASMPERDQVIATRTDLTYEPSATFLEDGTLQAGDVPVYRLFSSADGTHLYTASAAELTGLTTPGAAGYRADLLSEGVSFYAPAGNYI